MYTEEQDQLVRSYSKKKKIIVTSEKSSIKIQFYMTAEKII